MSDASRLSLFVSLRRDRLLFALVSTLVLLLHTLQPLAAANMPEDRHLAICTLHGLVDAGDATSETPTNPFDNCPVCMVSASCWNMAVGKAHHGTAAAFPAPDTFLVLTPYDLALQAGPAIRQGEPLPAIRAPPVSA